MPGLSVGVLGTGGVGIATAGAIIQQGLAGRVTFYNRSEQKARGEALDFLHALPLLPRTEVRGRGLDEIDEEDVLVCTIGHHTKPGETRLELLQANLEITSAIAERIEHGALPRVAIIVSNPLDVLTEYLTRRWEGGAVQELRHQVRLARNTERRRSGAGGNQDVARA